MFATLSMNAVHIALQSMAEAGDSSPWGWPWQCPIDAISWLVDTGSAVDVALAMPTDISSRATSVIDLITAAMPVR